MPLHEVLEMARRHKVVILLLRSFYRHDIYGIKIYSQYFFHCSIRVGAWGLGACEQIMFGKFCKRDHWWPPWVLAKEIKIWLINLQVDACASNDEFQYIWRLQYLTRLPSVRHPKIFFPVIARESRDSSSFSVARFTLFQFHFKEYPRSWLEFD